MVLMTPQQFRDWQARMGLSIRAAARELGVTHVTVANWRKFADALDDAPPHPIPRTVALACAALEAGLAPAGEQP